MFTHLPLEIRLLIWQLILQTPRIVQVNMRCLPEEPVDQMVYRCGRSDNSPDLECISSTPVPVLLHICSETRMLALAHYELTFGHKDAPLYQPQSVYRFDWGGNAISQEFIMGSTEEEIAKHAPKIYFNFEQDTILFRRTLLPRGQERNSGQELIYFPYCGHLSQKYFDSEQLQRIESLALGIQQEWGDDREWGDGRANWIFNKLNRDVQEGKYQGMKNLHLFLETSGLDQGQEVEFVNLRDERCRDEEMVREFVCRWKTAFKRRGEILVIGEGIEALKTICKEGLSGQPQLRDTLLKNGANAEEVLRCVWVKSVGWGK